jgi:hypothetical protein
MAGEINLISARHLRPDRHVADQVPIAECVRLQPPATLRVAQVRLKSPVLLAPWQFTCFLAE